MEELMDYKQRVDASIFLLLELINIHTDSSPHILNADESFQLRYSNVLQGRSVLP